MCGLFGVIGGATGVNMQSVDRFLQHAAICDMLRGEQSTGAFRVHNNNVDVFKKAVNGYDYVQEHGAKRVLNWTATVPAIVGHNRAATRGSVKDENAHPFTRGDITLVHNGHIQNHWDLADLCEIKHYEVDSDIAAAVLNKYEDPVEALSLLGGAYSLVWWDKRDGTLNFARNEQRPMHFADIVDENGGSKGVTLFASENGMLRWLAARNGLRLGVSYETKVGSLYTIHFDNGDIKETVVKEFTSKPYQKKFVSQNYGTGGASPPFKRNPYQSIREECVELLEEEFIQEGKTVKMQITNPKIKYEMRNGSAVPISGEVTLLLSEWLLPYTWRLSGSFASDKAVLDVLAQEDKLGEGCFLYAVLGGIFLNNFSNEKDALDCVTKGSIAYSVRTFNDNFVVTDMAGTPLVVNVGNTSIALQDRGTFTEFADNSVAASVYRSMLLSNNCSRVEEHRKAARTRHLPAFNTVFRVRQPPKNLQWVAQGDYVAFVKTSTDDATNWVVKVIDEHTGGFLKDGTYVADPASLERIHGKELRRVTKWFKITH